MIQFAVIGLGRAGAARVKCIHQHPQASLQGTVSRRGNGTHTLEQVLKDPFFEAVIICTENDTHYSLAKQALEHNKHVIVEFPLANHTWQIEELVTLANKNNLTLHCEMIGLLTTSHLHRKKQIQSKTLKTLSCSFQGNMYRWVLEEAQKGHHLQLAWGRLCAIWDLCGPLEFTKYTISQTPNQYHLDTELSNGTANVLLTETRGIDKKRQTKWNATFTDGTTFTPPPKNNKQGLFYQDLDWFIQSVSKNKPGYVSHKMLITIAHLIDSAVKSPPY